MNIDTALKIANLTRDQLHSMMKNYGWLPHGPGRLKRQGSARDFTPADVFDLAVAGALTSFGLNMRAVTEALASMPMPAVRDDFTQVEIFPGWLNARASGAPTYLVFQKGRSGELEAEFTANISEVENAIVLNASRLAAAIEAAQQQ